MEDEMIRNCIVLGVKYNHTRKKVAAENETGPSTLHRYMQINLESS